MLCTRKGNFLGEPAVFPVVGLADQAHGSHAAKSFLVLDDQDVGATSSGPDCCAGAGGPASDNDDVNFGKDGNTLFR